MKYTKASTLEAILKHAKAPEILEKFNVPCLGCAFAQAEMSALTIGAICEMYDLDLKGILGELNGESKPKATKPKKKK